MRHDPNNFKATQDIVDYAFSHGVNYFEACEFYCNYQCESIVAKSLSKYPRNSYYLCDKLDTKSCSLEELDKRFNDQLKKCNTDYFDVYLLQALDRTTISRVKQYYHYFFQKKQEGIIHKLGFSFHDTVDVLQYYLDNYQWDCCQIQCNYYDWYLAEAKKLYFLLKEKNIDIYVMGPFKGGTLTSKQPIFIQDYFGKDYLSHLALHFLQSLPQIKIVLSGGESLNMVQQNIKLVDEYHFTQQDKENCVKILECYKQSNHINCSGCDYCKTVCPQHIPISKILQLLNTVLIEPNNQEALQQYREIEKSQNSFFNCIGCRACEKRCPQHLLISEFMRNQLFTHRL